MPKVDLSDRFIAGLRPEAKAADYFDARTKGLNLRITPPGVKAWSVIFTSPRDGKRARLSLGSYPATSLATARTRAIEAHSNVGSGTDPRATEGSTCLNRLCPMEPPKGLPVGRVRFLKNLRRHR